VEAGKATVTGVGETLIRLAPGGGDILESAHAYAVHVGGAESNVCVNLAQLGVPTAWISRLPANPLGRRVAEAIRGFGVNLDGVIWAPEGRVGLMLVQPGAEPRAGEVIYYRRDSAFADIDPDEVQWSLLDGSRVVHLTGITPALGERPLRLVERAIAEARRRGIRISFDVNYRMTLWSPAAARQAMEPLVRGLDIVFINDRDAGSLFDVRGAAEATASTLRERFRCGVLVLTLGPEGALAAEEGGIVRHPAFAGQIVDRIGRGDAFAAGFLYGHLHGGTVDGLRYGSAMAALKQTYPGDVCRTTLGEVEAVLRGEAGGFRR
jgi:2-dehydro-3-deoxygluconokinase